MVRHKPGTVGHIETLLQPCENESFLDIHSGSEQEPTEQLGW